MLEHNYLWDRDITMTKKQLKAGETSILHKINWSRLVFDEAHHLRNKNTVFLRNLMMMKFLYLVLVFLVFLPFITIL
jgi:SNF2 family DNA or RNA helicase